MAWWCGLPVVWNMKSQSARLVHLTPRDDWGGAGLLGVTIRLDDYAGAEDRLVRVLTVEPGGPADIAGLESEMDFLLGTTHQTLDSVDRLATAVLQPNMNRVVELYVYNTVTDLVRVVALMPTYNWGSDGAQRRGLLGAEVATGYLHRLPYTTRGTAGSSVERKVRYVNVVEEENRGDGIPAQVHQQKLELEPQLEMEPDEEYEVESVQLTENDHQRNNVKLSPNGDQKMAASANGNRNHTEQLNAKLPARAPSSYGLQPLEVQAVFQKPPPTTVPDISASFPANMQRSYSNESTGSNRNTPPHQMYSASGATPSHQQHEQQYGQSQPQRHSFAAPQRVTSYNYQQPGPMPVPTYQQKSSPAAKAALKTTSGVTSGDNPFSAANGPLKPAAPKSGGNPFLVSISPKSGEIPPFLAAPTPSVGTHAFAMAPPPQMTLHGHSQQQQKQPPNLSPSFSSSYARPTYGGGGGASFGVGTSSHPYSGGTAYSGMQPPPPGRGGVVNGPYSAQST